MGPASDRRGRRTDQQTLCRGSVGAYQLQAAIAAVHDEAAERRGYRLAPDPRAVWRAQTHVRQPHGDAQLRHRCGHGARPRDRSQIVGGTGRGFTAGRPLSPRHRSRPSLRDGRRSSDGDRVLPGCGASHHEHSGTRLPHDASRPNQRGGLAGIGPALPDELACPAKLTELGTY